MSERIGGVLLATGDVFLGEGRMRLRLTVENTSRRIVRVGSHFPFWRTDHRLRFDRESAHGCRLDIPAGSTDRWGPGETREAALVRLGGAEEGGRLMPARLSREEYARRYGPTTGDRVRLGDTDLWIRVEHDDTAYGDELTYGWGQTVRTGLASARRATPSELDAVVIGGLVLDPLLGVVKTNLGIKEGRIAAVGRAGNPETMDDIAARIGPHTEIIPAHGCRNLTRDRLWANREALPIEVDVGDGTVFLDGRVLTSVPVASVPLSRRYLLA